MPDIMAVLACVSQCIEPTTLGQRGRVIEAMFSISGRVTMSGLSRWSGNTKARVRSCNHVLCIPVASFSA